MSEHEECGEKRFRQIVYKCSPLPSMYCERWSSNVYMPNMSIPISRLLLFPLPPSTRNSTRDSQAKIFFQEKFDDEGWRERWVVPTKWKQAEELGQWGWTAGEWFGGTEDDKGIQTSEDSRSVG